MSDDGFSDDWEDGEEEVTLDVESDSSPHFGLARLNAPVSDTGVMSFNAEQLRHGDFCLNPSAYGTFNGDNSSMDHDAMHSWLAKEEVESPDTDSEHPDIQGWTYLADYSLHPLTPNHSGPFQYYLHARIRHDNRLEFGMFERVISSSASAWKSALGKVNQILGASGLENSRFSSAQVLHGDRRPPLRIAGKEEAESVLLKNGKLVLSACPRSVGVMMNAGQAKIRLRYGDTSTYRLLTYYGHIWTYWAAIIDNVLYMVGVPLYTGADRGSYVYSIGGDATRVRIPLPPTIHDLRSHFVAGTNSSTQNGFSEAADLLWGIDEYSGLASVNHRVRPFLEQYGDAGSEVVLCRRALAKFSSDALGNIAVEQVDHGDIDTGLTLFSTEGGVYAEQGKLNIYEGEEINNAYDDHGATYAWSYSNGASGFVCTTTRCSTDGWVRYMAQAFYVTNYGPTYNIRLTTPFHPYGYIPEEGEEGYKLLSHSEATITVPQEPDEDPEDENPPGGGGGGSGGGGGGGSSGGGSGSGSGGSGAEDLGDCGIWLVSSEGVSVSRKRYDKNGKVGYEYKITINKTFSVSERLFYSVKARFSVNDGNSYGVDDDQQVTMWYYLQGEISTVKLCNLTSYSASGQGWTPNSHPSSRSEYDRTVLRSASATGSLPVRYMTSRSSVSSCNQSNIVKLVSTGRTRKFNASLPYIGTDGRKHRKRVTGTFKCYKLILQESNIKAILKNTLRSKTAGVNCTFTPTSITGSAGGTAGAPTVTCNGVSITGIPLPVQGESAVKGSYPMKITGKLGSLKATYTLENATTGWFEETPSNRYSASISGSFVVKAPSSQF